MWGEEAFGHYTHVWENKERKKECGHGKTYDNMFWNFLFSYLLLSRLKAPFCLFFFPKWKVIFVSSYSLNERVCCCSLNSKCFCGLLIRNQFQKVSNVSCQICPKKMYVVVPQNISLKLFWKKSERVSLTKNGLNVRRVMKKKCFAQGLGGYKKQSGFVVLDVRKCIFWSVRRSVTKHG